MKTTLKTSKPKNEDTFEIFETKGCRSQRLPVGWGQGEAGTGNVVEAVRHCRAVMGAIRQLQTLDDDELYVYAKEIRAPVDLVRQTKHLGRCQLFPLPPPLFLRKVLLCPFTWWMASEAARAAGGGFTAEGERAVSSSL